jgi:hypothetical protein
MEIYHMETTLKSWNYVYIINFCEWDFGSDVFTFLRRNLQLCWLAPVHYWCPATLCCRNGGRPSVEMCRLDLMMVLSDSVPANLLRGSGLVKLTAKVAFMHSKGIP